MPAERSVDIDTPWIGDGLNFDGEPGMSKVLVTGADGFHRLPFGSRASGCGP